ncbi:hypothetical protein, partial [Staphylococcus epidermidis]|uniref:hypothetical protein n=1 Tax=Staphylococcus epidermidis TaxID=1282 RepID=UPI001C92DC1A
NKMIEIPQTKKPALLIRRPLLALESPTPLLHQPIQLTVLHLPHSLIQIQFHPKPPEMLKPDLQNQPINIQLQ